MILVVRRDFLLFVTAAKMSTLCEISAFERSLMCKESRAVGEIPHDAVVKFDTYRNLQRHRAFLPATARLSLSSFSFFSSEFSGTVNSIPVCQMMANKTVHIPVPP